MINKKRLEVLFFTLFLLGIIVLTFFVFKPFFATLALGTTFSIVLYPLYKRIVKLFNGKESLASLATLIISFIFIMLPVFFLGQQAFKQANGLYDKFASRDLSELDTIVSSIEAPIQVYLPDFQIDAEQSGQFALGWVKSNFQNFVFGTLTILLDLFLMFIAIFFFLKDGDKFVREVISLSPLEDGYDKEILSQVSQTVTTVIKGALFIAIIQGFLVGLGLFIFNVPNAILWSALAAVCAFVPGLGTGLVILPAVAYLFITGNNGAAIALAAWGLVLVGTIDNFLGPYFYGKGTRIHSLLMLFSVLGGISIFGPEGFIFGPVIVSLFIASLRIYRTLILDPAQKQTE